MSTLEIIELIALIVIGVGLGIYYIVKAIKNHWVSKIFDAIKKGVYEAEQTGKKGKDKLDYALSYVQAVCDKEGIPFMAIKKLITAIINELVEGYNAIKKGK